MRIAFKIIFTIIIIISAVYSISWLVIEREASVNFYKGMVAKSDDQSIFYFDICTNLQPKFYRAYYFRGMAYMSKREYDHALENFKYCRNLLGQPYGQDSLYMELCRRFISTGRPKSP